MENINIRVRGIYATAISRILLKEGLKIVYATEKIRRRFGLDEDYTPPQVTVKDSEDKYGIVVVGEREPAQRIYQLLCDKIGDVFCWRTKIPLHSIIKGVVERVKGKTSVVSLGQHKGILNEQLTPGEEVLVEVARPLIPPHETAILSKKYTIYGDYVALIYGLNGRVIISRHIKNFELQRNLRMLTSLIKIDSPWGIKWRSTAMHASLDNLLEDVKKTMELARQILKTGRNAKIGDIVYEGEFLGILGLDRDAKSVLDKYRDEIIRTIDHHHIYKSLSDELTQIVDFSEYLLNNGSIDRGEISKSINGYIVNSIKIKGRVDIEHISILKNQVIKLSPGIPVKIDYNRASIFGVLKRRLKEGGKYDGLNIPIEKGDYDLMEFSTKSPLIIHKYYSENGRLKGIYININTYPEISPSKLRYFDLEVDIVIFPNGNIEVLDINKLDEAHNNGIISTAKYEKTIFLINNIVDSFKESRIPIHEISLAVLTGMINDKK